MLSKLSQPMDHSEDAETISQVNSESADDCVFNDTRHVKSDSTKFHAERAQSAPGIVATPTVPRLNR